jgi:hypothetical protein
MFRAVVIGAVAAVVSSFLIAAGYGFCFGAREPWGEVAAGWEGTQNGVKSLVFFGAVFPPFFPAVGLAGAAVGLVVRAVRRSLVKGSRESNP